MKVIAVTGGIGSGKSAACRFLNRTYGWPVYDADRRVKELYEVHPTLLSDIEKALGRCFRDMEGNFSPRMLAEVIFSDKGALDIVEGIIFPILIADFAAWKRGQSSDCVVLESATVLEKQSLKDMWDVLLIIDAPAGVRAERAAERDGVSLDSVCARMACQPMMNAVSEGFVPSSADYVLINDSTEQNMQNLLKKWVEKQYNKNVFTENNNVK